MTHQVLFPNMERAFVAGAANTPDARAFRLPIWAPDPCFIVSARMFNQAVGPANAGNVGLWQLCFDPKGAYVSATDYPFTQTCKPGDLRCNQHVQVIADYNLETNLILGPNYRYDPPLRYSRSEGDLMLADQPCGGGHAAQMIWIIGWEDGAVPALPTAPSSHAIAFSDSPSGTNGAPNVSIRNLCSLSSGGNRVRATFKAGSGGRYVVDNASIGISNGTQSDTVDFPVELTFNGDSGFDIPAGTTITSDWSELTTANGQTAVVVVDNNALSNDSLNSAGTIYWTLKYQTYCLKKVGALMGTATGTHGIVSIECGT